MVTKLNQREQKILDIAETAINTWQHPNIGDSKERLIYKAECYYSALKEIHSFFTINSKGLRTDSK